MAARWLPGVVSGAGRPGKPGVAQGLHSRILGARRAAVRPARAGGDLGAALDDASPRSSYTDECFASCRLTNDQRADGDTLYRSSCRSSAGATPAPFSRQSRQAVGEITEA